MSCHERFLRHISTGRRSELTFILPAELRTAFIADHNRRRAGVLSFQQHKALGFIEAQALLELERTEACHLSEMPVKGRRSHVHPLGQLFNMQGLHVVFPQPGNGPGNLVGLRAACAEQPHPPRLPASRWK